MAHYAVLDENNVVIDVFVGKDEHELLNGHPTDWEQYYGAKRTSYNTFAGQHKTGGTPFRKNYAGLGYTYDAVRDAFIPPRPLQLSWVLNEDKCIWEPPIPMPQDGNLYSWNEDILQWELVAMSISMDVLNESGDSI